MINNILVTYARQMEQYLSSFFHQPEGLVEVGMIGAQSDEEPCKLQVSLLSVEREVASGISTRTSSSGSFVNVSFPPIYANLNVVIAAVFSERKYKESLSFLSLAIAFLQSTPVFTTADGNRYTIEMMTPSLQDISNIWTLFGGRHYPSVVCKIRRLTFDAGEMKQTITRITGQETDISS